MRQATIKNTLGVPKGWIASFKEKRRVLPKVRITDAANGEFKISCSKKVKKGIYTLNFVDDDSNMMLKIPLTIEVVDPPVPESNDNSTLSKRPKKKIKLCR